MHLMGDRGCAMSEREEAVVSRIWDEIWNKGAVDVCDEVFAANYEGHLPAMATTVRGPEAFKQLVRAYLTAFPDVHLSVHDVFSVGDRVAVRWSSHGTNTGPFMGMPPTGRRMELPGISIFRMEGDKVAAEWEGFDTLALMQQLGVVPEPAGAA